MIYFHYFAAVSQMRRWPISHSQLEWRCLYVNRFIWWRLPPSAHHLFQFLWNIHNEEYPRRAIANSFMYQHYIAVERKQLCIHWFSVLTSFRQVHSFIESYYLNRVTVDLKQSTTATVVVYDPYTSADLEDPSWPRQPDLDKVKWRTRPLPPHEVTSAAHLNAMTSVP